MTSKQFVRSYYPDAYVERDSNTEVFIWAYTGKWEFIIGEGGSNAQAWEDAERYIRALPEDQVPEIKINK